MRAQCCICADLFENTGNLNIAAVPCGHTFHEECLMRWLANSSTCPSCRKQVKKNQIIKRLFFDIPELNDETADDNDTLHNQISSLKAQICSLNSLKKDLTEVQDKLAACVASKQELLDKLKKADRDRIILERQVIHVTEENRAYHRDHTDYEDTKKKLRHLENIERMLEGTEVDVSEMIKCHSEGGDIKQLSSMLVVMKREYNKALEDKKAFRTENRDLNLQALLANSQLTETRKQLKSIHSQLKEANKAVFELERKNNHNRRKIAHLRHAVKSNKTEGSQSFISAVHEDSPNVAYTPPPPPKLSAGCDLNKSDKNENEREKSSKSNRECHSPDLFDESSDNIVNDDKKRKVNSRVPVVSNDQDDTPVSNRDPEQERIEFYESAPSVMKMIRLTSAADRFRAAKARKIEAENDSVPICPSFAKFSIMQKKFTGLSSNRPLSLLERSGLPKNRAYNGLGGSTKIVDEAFETPFRKHSHIVKKKTTKKRSPLASKPIPNQPKLPSCLPTSSSTPAPSRLEKAENVNVGKCRDGSSSSSSTDMTIGNISPIATEVSSSTSRAPLKITNKKKNVNKQHLVNNMFAKSDKTSTGQKSKKTTTATHSSSDVPFGLKRPVNDVIDLT